MQRQIGREAKQRYGTDKILKIFWTDCICWHNAFLERVSIQRHGFAREVQARFRVGGVEIFACKDETTATQGNIVGHRGS